MSSVELDIRRIQISHFLRDFPQTGVPAEEKLFKGGIIF